MKEKYPVSYSELVYPIHKEYVADKGFAGDQLHWQWYEQYGAQVVSPPHQKSKVLNTFRLAWKRPHALDGFQARLAAKVALHNFCIWLNLQLGREPLAFAELLEW